MGLMGSESSSDLGRNCISTKKIRCSVTGKCNLFVCKVLVNTGEPVVTKKKWCYVK
jgi:hypothetical protein